MLYSGTGSCVILVNSTKFLIFFDTLYVARAGNRSGSPNGFFNRLTMVRIGAVNFR